MKHITVCSALKTPIVNDIGSVRFPNPVNPKEWVIRSTRARQIVAPYDGGPN